MKTPNRIHANTGSKPAKSQAETDEAREAKEAEAKLKVSLQLPPDAQTHLCLCLYDRNCQEIVRKIPLAEDDCLAAHLSAKKKWASQPTYSLDNFVAEAIQEKLKREKVLFGDFDFEIAIYRAIHLIDSLHQTLAAKIEEDLKECARTEYFELKDKSLTGQVSLVTDIQHGLCRCIDLF